MKIQTQLLFVLLSTCLGCSSAPESVVESRSTPSAEEVDAGEITQQSAEVDSSAGAELPPSAMPVNADASETDWPTFRGPTQMGVAAGNVPLTWSESENIVWQVALPGAGSSSPIVFGDHIYLTCYDGYNVPGESGGSLDDLTRSLVCFDRETGQQLWIKTVKATLPEEEQIRDHGYAGNTPVADSERVYAMHGKNGVYAYDHDGNELWHTEVGEKTHGWGSGTSLVRYQDLLIVNASVESQSLYALNCATGDEVWSAGDIEESWNTPIIAKTPDGDDELLVARFGSVYGFDPLTGEKLWSCETGITWYIVPTIVVNDGVAYVFGGRSGLASLAIKLGGRGDVTQSHKLWSSKKGSNVNSPVYRDGHLYWCHEQMGIAYCADAKTGNVVFENRLERAGQFYASTLLVGDRVYCLDRSGKMFVFAAKPEFELLAKNELRDGTNFDASPTVTGTRLLLRSQKTLYCIGEE